MYIVISKWEPLSGREEDWKSIAESVRTKIDDVKGVEFAHRFVNEHGQMVVAMGYTDEATYNSLVNDPNGEMAKLVADANIESVARWVSSERGASFD